MTIQNDKLLHPSRINYLITSLFTSVYSSSLYPWNILKIRLLQNKLEEPLN